MMNHYRTGDLCRDKPLRRGNLVADLFTRVINFPKKTGTARDAGSVMGSFPGPIIPAWVGEMVTAAAIPMTAPKIRVLICMFMVRPL